MAERNFDPSENSRLSSFPPNPTVPQHLAIAYSVAGFQYVRGCFPMITVRCISCELQFECSMPALNPLAEHMRRSQSCEFLRDFCGSSVGNGATGGDEQAVGDVQQYTGSSHAVNSSPCHESSSFDADLVDLVTDPETRLMTFDSPCWPKDCPVDKEEMAAAGFYFIGKEDMVRCFSCGAVIHNWEAGDNPFDEHLRLVPNCPFLSGLQSGTLFTLMDEAGKPILDPHYDSSAMHDERHRRSTYANYPREAAAIIPVSALARAGFYYTGTKDMARCAFCHVILKGLKRGDFARRVHRQLSPLCPLVRGSCLQNVPASELKVGMHDEVLRLESFADWPKQLGVSVGELSAAGFYYSGTGDCVTCFSCLQSVRDWSPGQCVASRHRAASPSCLHNNGLDSRNCPIVVKCPSDLSPFKEEKTRVLSFRNWPTNFGVMGEELAEAGFFCLDASDAVKCPFCGVEVHHWHSGQSAWRRHQSFSPACGFVRQHCPVNVDESSLFYTQQQSALDGSAASLPGFHCSSHFLAARQSSLPSVGRQPVASVSDTGVFGNVQELLEHQSANATGISQALATLPAGAVEKDVEQRRPPWLSCENLTDKDEELERLRTARTCVVCLDREISCVFLPCAHVICCSECAACLKQCPFCQVSIEKSIRSFHP